MSRPSSYTPEIAEAICLRLATGESLRSICRDEAMPCRSAVNKWVVDNINEFAHQYARSKAIGIDEIVDESIEISDDGARDYTKDADGRDVVDHDHIARARLRVDTRKWYVSKLAPKLYGDRTAVELSGPDGGPIVIDDHARMVKIDAIYAAAARLRDADDYSDLV